MVRCFTSVFYFSSKNREGLDSGFQVDTKSWQINNNNNTYSVSSHVEEICEHLGSNTEDDKQTVRQGTEGNTLLYIHTKVMRTIGNRKGTQMRPIRQDKTRRRAKLKTLTVGNTGKQEIHKLRDKDD